MAAIVEKNAAVEIEARETPHAMRGARILCEALLREGVDTIFGYPGGAVLHVMELAATSRAPFTWPRGTPKQPAKSA